MRRLRFPLAVGVTSLVLVAVIGVVGVLTVRSALANSPWAGWMGFGNQGVGGPGLQLPPELQGLGSVPPGERFGHFLGVQVSLKDKDNQPLTVNVIPGTVTSTSATSLTLAANDGTSRTFALTDSTAIRGKTSPSGAQNGQTSLASGDKVVVITLSGDASARAVIDGGPEGFSGPPGWGHFGPFH